MKRGAVLGVRNWFFVACCAVLYYTSLYFLLHALCGTDVAEG
jgi:hypothetical protein